jgi:hypothetical protein
MDTVVSFVVNGIDMEWTFITAAAPCLILVVLLPACFSERIILRWLAFALCLFPGSIAFIQWAQLLGLL